MGFRGCCLRLLARAELLCSLYKAAFGIICYIQITFITVSVNYKKTSSFMLFCVMLMCLEECVRCLDIYSRPNGLMDTFHEPFKLVVSSNPPIPETPVLKDAEPCSETEPTGVEKDTDDTSKKRGKKLSI